MSRESIDAGLEMDDHHKTVSTYRPKRKVAMIMVGSVAFVAFIIAVISVSMSKSRTKSKAAENGSSNSYTFVQNSEVFTNDGTLPAFTQQVLGGYKSCIDLEADILTALQDLAYSTIQQQKNHDHSWCYYTFYNTASAESSDTSDSSSRGSSNSVTGESSYETNNQVKGVDEADMVKSDGTHIFAGYGNEVIITDLNGTIVTRISVPDIPIDKPTSKDSSSTASSRMPPYYYIPPTRQVQALLLYNDILTVITYYYNWKNDNAMGGGNTTAFLYKFDPKNSTLTLTSQIDMTGYFSGGRSVGSNMYVVTNAYINTWPFTQNFSRCNEAYKHMNAEEYERAASLAVNATAATFAQKLMEAILWTPSIDTTSSCKNIIRISTMTNQNLTAIKEQRRLGGMWLYDQGLLQNFIQLTSFDVDQGSLAAIKSNSAGAFSAGYSPQIYATEDRLILATQGYRYEPISGNEASYNEYTYLLTFNLSGSVATPALIGEVDGYLNDQYSIDYFNGFYRIATTIRQKWGSSYNPDSNSYTWEPISESTSQVYVLEEKSSGLEISGAVKDLGKGEVIQSVRFLGDKGYVVTFHQIDPLFIIDFSSPTEPVVSGELKATGFSQYMHPIKNGNFLLTVGQEATAEGQIIGIKFSVFNVTDPASPVEAQKYVVKNGEGWASTDASWDYHAFRYLDQSEILIVPESIYNWENPSKALDGFVVYKIDLVHGIKPIGNVTHANYEYMQYYCWGSSYLPSRSMVFNRDLVTFKSHSILRTSTVETLKEKVWELNLDDGRNKSHAKCYNYGPWMY